jgi:hypothetical protein
MNYPTPKPITSPSKPSLQEIKDYLWNEKVQKIRNLLWTALILLSIIGSYIIIMMVKQ